MSKTPSREEKDDPQSGGPAQSEEPGSNEVEHEPDPQARPIPDGQHKYTPRSPYTAGND